MKDFLAASEVIDWQNPEIKQLAQEIASAPATTKAIALEDLAIAKACFEWVRDEIHHSVDYRMNPVTCRASDVLKYRTGYCFAKSHLLAALLRANQIPAGFCYQRLSIDDKGAPYSLHGFNAVYLNEFGWYRIDARGNKAGVNAQFTPPQEQLAYQVRLSEEKDFQTIFAQPLPAIVAALEAGTTWNEMLHTLPDITVESAKECGLTS